MFTGFLVSILSSTFQQDHRIHLVLTNFGFRQKINSSKHLINVVELGKSIRETELFTDLKLI